MQVTDPRAVPAVWEVFAAGDQKSQLMAVQVLGQIDGPAASRAVAAIALFSPYADVRGRAIDTAVRRDPRDFLEPLLAMIHRTFRYKVQPLSGPGLGRGALRRRRAVQYPAALPGLAHRPQPPAQPDLLAGCPFNPVYAGEHDDGFRMGDGCRERDVLGLA